MQQFTWLMENTLIDEKRTSLGKALGLLSAIGSGTDPSGVAVADLIAQTGLSRPTTYRLLSELQKEGFVVADAKAPTWRLGPKIIALASVAGSWTALRRRARAAMQELVDDIGHTVHLGIRDGLEIVYIDKTESPRHLALSSSVGQRRPINVTALGKCLVAFDPSPDLAEKVVDEGLTERTPHSINTREAWMKEIEKVRREGVAYDVEECDLGANCVAAPIRDGHGYAIAAISLSALMRGQGELDLHLLATKVRAVADRIGMGE